MTKNDENNIEIPLDDIDNLCKSHKILDNQLEDLTKIYIEERIKHQRTNAMRRAVKVFAIGVTVAFAAGVVSKLIEQSIEKE